MIVETQIMAAKGESDDDLRLEDAVKILVNAFPSDRPPEGFVRGRTQMRNALAEESGCSLLHAEELILQLDRRGYLKYEGNPRTLETAPTYWTISGARPPR